jgi:hypothetical protein
LGGCTFPDKWGTPDVIGVRKARESDVGKFPTEIIAAEIKLDTKSLITGFGQACSYRLFSHRCYLVIPKSSVTEDLARLELLCIVMGLGLVLFDESGLYDSGPRFTDGARSILYESQFEVDRGTTVQITEWPRECSAVPCAGNQVPPDENSPHCDPAYHVSSRRHRYAR